MKNIWNADRFFYELSFIKQMMTAEIVTVIRQKHNDGIICQLTIFKLLS